MKNKGFTTVEVIAGLSLFFLLAFVIVFPSCYGLYLAFKASILLGIVTVLIEPSPFILGLIAVFGHPEVSAKLAAWLHLPF